MLWVLPSKHYIIIIYFKSHYIRDNVELKRMWELSHNLPVNEGKRNWSSAVILWRKKGVRKLNLYDRL